LIFLLSILHGFRLIDAGKRIGNDFDRGLLCICFLSHISRLFVQGLFRLLALFDFMILDLALFVQCQNFDGLVNVLNIREREEEGPELAHADDLSADCFDRFDTLV
jgi:hypothetical protein